MPQSLSPERRAGRGAAGRGIQDDAGRGGGVRALHGGHLEQQGHAGAHPAEDVRGRAGLRRPTLHLHLLAPRYIPEAYPCRLVCGGRRHDARLELPHAGVVLAIDAPAVAPGVLLAGQSEELFLRFSCTLQWICEYGWRLRPAAQLLARWRVAAVHAGPLSEVGELREPTEDTHSIYGDSDLMSSDGREQVCRRSSPSALLCT